MNEDKMAERIAGMYLARESRLEKIERILEEKSMDKISGVNIDIVTANMLKKLYDAVKPDLKKKFDKLPIKKLVAFGWSLVK